MKSLATLAAFSLLFSVSALAQRSSSGGHSGGGHYGHSGGSVSGHGGYGYGYGYRGGRTVILPSYSYIPSYGFAPYGYSGFYSGSVSDYGYGIPAPQPAPDYPAGFAQPAAPPVVINQTFINGAPAQSSQPSQDQGTDVAQPRDPESADSPHLIEAPAPTPQEWSMSEGRYYLIAYKDHSVYTALAYWMESGALHYVTPQNAHNQVSLDLLDLDLTKKLNAGRGLGFNLPPQR
jgi:hypothetical protein